MLLKKNLLSDKASLQRIRKWAGIVLMGSVISACAGNTSPTLYEQMGGQDTMVKLADQFIMEIAYDDRVFPRFADSNVERFREKMIEHFCMVTDGPCEYTGDSMINVHAGMDINSAEFNAVVENLMAAMNKTGIPLSAQNQLLERLAILRPEIMGI